jgi:hypothetical protein
MGNTWPIRFQMVLRANDRPPVKLGAIFVTPISRLACGHCERMAPVQILSSNTPACPADDLACRGSAQLDRLQAGSLA